METTHAKLMAHIMKNAILINCFNACFLADSPANETKSSSSSFCSLGSDEEPVTDEQLYCIREEIGMKWKDVLRKLGLKEPMIENICVNHKEYGVEEMCYQGLLEWKKRFSEEATTKKLCEVLDELRCSEALKMLSKEGTSTIFGYNLNEINKKYINIS